MNRTIIAVSLFFLISAQYMSAEDQKVKSGIREETRGFSLFLEYPVIFDEGESEPYYYNTGAGFAIDFGGRIPVLNMLGIEFSAVYSYLNQHEDMHYISFGPGLYLRSGFDSPVNIGIRAGAGSSLIISAETDEETDNNRRSGGVYTCISPFVELKGKSRFYIHAGYEMREQTINNMVMDNEESSEDYREDFKVKLDIIVLRAGLRF